MGFTVQRKQAAHDLAEYFAELGEVPSYHEYKRMEDTPVSTRRINTLFRTYGRMVKMLPKWEPELMGFIESGDEFIAEPKDDTPPPGVEADALAAMKAALESAKSEKTDG